ncbi:MAG TPA: 50S ribosomal protein L7Ae [Candidatus Nanoarchaeia archaeon]|nr:50S ribosomal protein L7Ae [Candidatus Nanoarchaeia archaeon]
MDLNTNIPKETLDKAYEALELAVKSGKVKKGTNEVTKAIERGTAKLVLVAQDTNPREIVMHIPALCEEKEIPCVPVPKRQELGEIAHLTVPTSAIAITQEGEAKQMIKELSYKLKAA